MYYDQSDGMKNSGSNDEHSGSSLSSDISSKKHRRSFETSINDLKRLPDILKLSTLPIDDPSHTVLVDPNFRRGTVPRPCSGHHVDKWDEGHVHMPCSPENVMAVRDEKNNKKYEKQWDVIKRKLQMPIKSSKDLEAILKSYNDAESRSKWDFTGLHFFFERILNDAERQKAFSVTLPYMVKLILELPQICPHPIPLLKHQTSHMITLSQKQVACLLANAFFCTFPGRDRQDVSLAKYKTFPTINFSQMYARSDRGMSQKVAQKMKCILHYFERCAMKEPDGCVSFQRQCLKQFPKWEREEVELGNFHVTSEGMIEAEGAGMLQLDFADKYIGGLLFTHGLVQEEIRFVICPELIISRLFTEVIDANECVIITGCEQFSTYAGYAHTFQWTGDYIDSTTRDEWNRRHTQVLAIDATRFSASEQQYALEHLKRDIEKAYCGFCAESPGFLSAVATGNWGCGIFRGDPHLKSLLQWMAASVAGRDLCYFTFHDRALAKDISNMFGFLREKKVTVGKLWKLLLDYKDFTKTTRSEGKGGLYGFIYKMFGEEREIFYTKKPSSNRGRNPRGRGKITSPRNE